MMRSRLGCAAMRRLVAPSFCLLLTAWGASAQQDRITVPIDTGRTAVLTGNRNARAVPEADLGAVEAGQAISGITVVFKRTASQQAALDQLLAEQQDPASPNYHNWLTPEQFAERFGIGAADSAKVAAWLRSQGLTVAYEARSRTYLTCTGTAAEVRRAFHTELHRYRVDGETHFANSSDPAIPAALEPVVMLIQGLDDFYPQPPKHTLKPIANYDMSGGGHALLPGDIATIYDINRLYQDGFTGAGQKIGVMGSSNINMSDLEYFRAHVVGLAKNDPQMVLVPGSADPGINGGQVENTLDLEYAGAIAQKAAVVFVYAPNVFSSAQYAIDQNLAPVITFSYCVCELAISSSPAAVSSIRSLAQQGNAEGITWLAASGDWGASGCDTGEVQVATHGLAVAMPASVPEVTGVGGTEFVEGSGTYWNAGNDPTTGASALRYIPEKAWNDTAISVANGGSLSSGGGGASIFFSKPAWQTAPGVPNDGARDVPDISFDSANDHDPYYVWVNGAISYMGGTSVATPIFAGVVTLLNQYLAQAKPGLGNINPTLYSLAQTASVYNDITAGDIIQPCTYGTPDCVNGQLGYSAGTGYDLATGLGSADIYQLFAHWPGGPGHGSGLISTTTRLAGSPSNFAVTGTTALTATVTAASGTNPPNGTVSFNLGTNALGTANLSGSGAVATATLAVYGSQLDMGANTISASYSGSTAFLPSSGSTSVTVTAPVGTSAVIPSVLPNPVYQQPVSNNCTFFFTVRLTETNGVATTLTGFRFGSTDYSSSIPAFFGSATIPSMGTISAALCTTMTTVPSTVTLNFSGSDTGGHQWAQQLAVQFYPAQVSASMALSSSPGTEVENPSGDPKCDSSHPFYQQLNLQELNGYEVYLTRFLAGGNDLSSQIAQWFGTLRLAPLGALQANICWRIGSPPTTLSYEIDGVDSAGHTITTTASVPFNPPPTTSGGTLAASQSSVSLGVATGPSATTSATVGVIISGGQVWTASLFPANQKTNWLVVDPQSGTGPGQVRLVASGAGLAAGVYTATLVLQSVNTIPQFVNVPITFTVGGSSQVNITAVANGASFQQAFAPGEILSVFGTNLTTGSVTAATAPLPYTLSGVSASINGVPAPLYGVYNVGSYDQINLQIPYEIPARSALLAVNNNGKVATYRFNVAPANPGIFYDYGSGLLTPISTASAGQSVIFFITGEGDVSPFATTGSTPTGAAITNPPAPRLPFILTVGGVPVTPAFVGVPSWSVGVTQVNFAVPASVPQGRQPVVVTVGGLSSATSYLNVTGAAGNVQLTFIPPSVNQSPSDGGWHYEVQLTETNGLGINITNLTVFGNDYTSNLTEWFGTSRIPAFGTLAGYFVATCSCAPPWDGTWQVSGTDDNGNSGTWNGVVHFLPPSTSSAVPSARRPEAVERVHAALDAIPADERLYPASEGAVPSAASAPFHLFDLLSVSGVTPPTHPEGARNAKAPDALRRQ